jgi:hypothetical protein
MVEYFAIKRPDSGYVGWIAHSEHNCWQLFFRDFPCPTSRYEGQKAYEAIGYKCIAVEVKEI